MTFNNEQGVSSSVRIWAVIQKSARRNIRAHPITSRPCRAGGFFLSEWFPYWWGWMWLSYIDELGLDSTLCSACLRARWVLQARRHIVSLYKSPRNHQQPELCNDRSLLTRTALCEADIKKNKNKKHFKEQFLNLFKLFAGEKKKKLP